MLYSFTFQFNCCLRELFFPFSDAHVHIHQITNGHCIMTIEKEAAGSDAVGKDKTVIQLRWDPPWNAHLIPFVGYEARPALKKKSIYSLGQILSFLCCRSHCRKYFTNGIPKVRVRFALSEVRGLVFSTSILLFIYILSNVHTHTHTHTHTHIHTYTL